VAVAVDPGTVDPNAAGPGLAGFLPAPPRVGTPDERQYSRARSGVTSFGPTGRVVITALTLAPPVTFWLIGGTGLLVPIVIWGLLAVPLVLRDVWKRERTR
jgi:hypothetical protein